MRLWYSHFGILRPILALFSNFPILSCIEVNFEKEVIYLYIFLFSLAK